MRSSKTWLNRIRAAQGESIVETLAAVLICSLAVLMLYTAISSAARMNAQADQAAQNLQHDFTTVEMQNSSAPLSGIVTIDGFDYQYFVNIHEGEGGLLRSYSLA